jgi:hypothetical protein
MNIERKKQYRNFVNITRGTEEYLIRFGIPYPEIGNALKSESFLIAKTSCVEGSEKDPRRCTAHAYNLAPTLSLGWMATARFYFIDFRRFTNKL